MPCGKVCEFTTLILILSQKKVKATKNQAPVLKIL